MTDIVYTALFGKYENLNERLAFGASSTRYVCFTDDADLKSESWEIIQAIPKSPNNASRASRYIKMLGHRLLPSHSRSLYIDNSVSLKVDGKTLLDSWLVDTDVAMMKHYRRESVKAEFFICSAYSLDKQEILRNQYNFYKKWYPHILAERPFWGGMIAKVNSPASDRLMETWMNQFDLFSRRDQLSINVSSFISGIPIKMIDAENDSSEWHTWPIHLNRNLEMRDVYAKSKFRKARVIITALTHGVKYYLP